MCGKSDPDPFVHSQNGTTTLLFGVQEVYLERIQEIRCQGILSSEYDVDPGVVIRFGWKNK